MLEKTHDLGKLESEHGISPAYLQRAAIIAGLSLIFFLTTLFGFYIERKFGYFLISTAFLIVYIFMMLGILSQRRNTLKVYEEGFSYKNFVSRWDELELIDLKMESRFAGIPKINCKIGKINGEKTVLTESIEDIEKVIGRIIEEREKRRERVDSEDGDENPN